jgi:hypothetical protein
MILMVDSMAEARAFTRGKVAIIGGDERARQ